MSLASSQEMLDKFSGKYQHKIKRTCEPFFQFFGANHFFIQSISHDGFFHGIGTNPDFMHFYMDQKMHECNPFITQPEKLQEGIYFFNSVPNEKFQSSIQIIKEKYKLQHSLVIIENEKDCCHQYGFAVDPERHNAETLMMNEMPLVKEFIKYFKKELSDVLRCLKANAINVGKKEFLKSNVLPEIQLDYLKRMKFLASLKAPRNLLTHTKLSKREIECLKLYLQGKSSSEIGEDLELTKRTIEFYFQNIKNKLSCYKKSELIALLIQMGKLGLYKDFLQ